MHCTLFAPPPSIPIPKDVRTGVGAHAVGLLDVEQELVDRVALRVVHVARVAVAQHVEKVELTERPPPLGRPLHVRLYSLLHVLDRPRVLRVLER